MLSVGCSVSVGVCVSTRRSLNAIISLRSFRRSTALRALALGIFAVWIEVRLCGLTGRTTTAAAVWTATLVHEADKMNSGVRMGTQRTQRDMRNDPVIPVAVRANSSRGAAVYFIYWISRFAATVPESTSRKAAKRTNDGARRSVLLLERVGRQSVKARIPHGP